MEIEDADGNRLAMVKKALISPLRDRWTVEIEGGSDLDIRGNIVAHEYTFTEGRAPVASVSKSWFRVADSYGGRGRARSGPGADPRRDRRSRHDGSRRTARSPVRTGGSANSAASSPPARA